MSFVIDGADWRFEDVETSIIFEEFERLFSLVANARLRGQIVWLGDDFQYRQIVDKKTLWDFFGDAPHELRQELSAWMGRAQYYCEHEFPPGFGENFEISVNGELQVNNADVSWAHHKVMNAEAVACIGVSRKGRLSTSSSSGSVDLHWLDEDDSSREFARYAIVLEGDNEASLEALAPAAYPDLHFHPDFWPGLKRIAGGYPQLRDVIQRYLAVLDKHGKWIFTHQPPALTADQPAGPDASRRPSRQLIEKRFYACHLIVSPENANVYGDDNCRRAREVQFEGSTLYCEWHGKLQPHQNRLHIHPPVPESLDKVVIAIICDHLPTP